MRKLQTAGMMADLQVTGKAVLTKEISTTQSFSFNGVTTQVHLIILGFTWLAASWMAMFEKGNLAIVTVFGGAFLLKILFGIINVIFFRNGLKVSHETNLLTTSVILIFSFGIPLVFFMVQFNENMFLTAFSYMLTLSMVPFLYSKSGKTFKWVAAFMMLLVAGQIYTSYFYAGSAYMVGAFTGAVVTFFGLLNNPYIVKNNFAIE